MTAFDQLEDRLLSLTLNRADTAVASRPATLSVGLFKSQPADNWDGLPGAYGEPKPGSSNYERSRCAFRPVDPPTTTTAPDGTKVLVYPSNPAATNAEALAFTGLSAGTYTHFAIFGNYVPYAAYGIAADQTVVFPGSNTPGITAPSQTIPGSSASPSQPAGGFAATVIVEDGLWQGPKGDESYPYFNSAVDRVLFRGLPGGTNRRGVPRTSAQQIGDPIDPNGNLLAPSPQKVAPGDWVNDNGTGPLLNAATYTPDGDYALGAATGIPPTMEEQGTNIDMYAQNNGFGFDAGNYYRVAHQFRNPLPGNPEHLHSAILARYDRSVNQGAPDPVLFREAGNLRRSARGGARRFDVRPQDVPGGVMTALTFELRNFVEGSTDGTYTTSLVTHSLRCDHVFRTVPVAVAGITLPGYNTPPITVGGVTIPSQPIPPLVIPASGRLPIGYVPLYWGTLTTSVTVGGPGDVVVIPVGGLRVTAA